MPITEKLQLVEDLWDNIAVTDWQKEELARRKANYLRDPSSGRSWEEVKHYVRHRHG